MSSTTITNHPLPPRTGSWWACCTCQGSITTASTTSSRTDLSKFHAYIFTLSPPTPTPQPPSPPPPLTTTATTRNAPWLACWVGNWDRNQRKFSPQLVYHHCHSFLPYKWIPLSLLPPLPSSWTKQHWHCHCSLTWWWTTKHLLSMSGNRDNYKQSGLIYANLYIAPPPPPSPPSPYPLHYCQASTPPLPPQPPQVSLLLVSSINTTTATTTTTTFTICFTSTNHITANTITTTNSKTTIHNLPGVDPDGLAWHVGEHKQQPVWPASPHQLVYHQPMINNTTTTYLVVNRDGLAWHVREHWHSQYDRSLHHHHHHHQLPTW